MIGCDTYLDGHGQMVGKLFGLVTIVDGRGEEFDIGELTTYLNDAILIAPSMLLGPGTTWREVDDHSFDVTLTDAGRSVTGRVSSTRWRAQRLQHDRPVRRPARGSRPSRMADTS